MSKNKESHEIFSGENSREMWDALNYAKTKKQLRMAIYLVCVKLQELEHRIETENEIYRKSALAWQSNCEERDRVIARMEK